MASIFISVRSLRLWLPSDLTGGHTLTFPLLVWQKKTSEMFPEKKIPIRPIPICRWVAYGVIDTEKYSSNNSLQRFRSDGGMPNTPKGTFSYPRNPESILQVPERTGGVIKIVYLSRHGELLGQMVTSLGMNRNSDPRLVDCGLTMWGEQEHEAQILSRIEELVMGG